MIRIVWINTLSLATKAFVLQSVLVRGSVSEGTVETGLRKTMLDIGVPQMTGGPLVEGAEECRCPPGYSGFSCESCSIGFYRNVTIILYGVNMFIWIDNGKYFTAI